MPILTPSAVHIDTPLSNLTLAYVQDQTNFIADKVFPVLGVPKQSDKFYIYDRANMNRTGDVKKLAPRTEVNRIGMSISNSSYFADVYGLGMDFDIQTMANEDAMLDMRAAGAETLVTRMLIDREEKFATTFFAASVWSTEYTGVANADNDTAAEVTQWSDYTNSTPIVDVTNARRALQLKSGGYKANTMVIGKEVRDILINHPDILARLNGGATVANTALITNAKLAEVFEVENLYIMEAVRNDSVEGVAESNSFIGGKSVLLVHTPRTAGLMTPAAGMTFAWNNIPGVSNLGVTVESFTDDALRRVGVAEEIQVKMAYDMQVVGADLGVFFKTIVA